MPKRKRADDEGGARTEEPEKQRLTLRAARLEQKIEHGSLLLSRALKTARGFERQKLGRRQKQARSKNDRPQLARLEDEVQALKVVRHWIKDCGGS
jgi:hypothetical protein